MRKFLSFFTCIAVAAILLSGCFKNSDVDEKKDDFAVADTIKVTDMAPSGATKPFTVSSAADIKAIFMNLATDPAIMSVIKKYNPSSGTVENSGLLSAQNIMTCETTVSRIESDIRDIVFQILNFPKVKSFSKSIYYNDVIIEEYIKLNNLTVGANASVVTSDGKDLDIKSFMNFKSLDAEGQLSASADLFSEKIPPVSAVKDFKIRVKAEGDASCGSLMLGNLSIPANLSTDYTVSMNAGISVKNNITGEGGIIILSTASKNSSLIQDLTSKDYLKFFKIIVPSVDITVTVYDDACNVIFTKSYVTVDELLKDFQIILPN